MRPFRIIKPKIRKTSKELDETFSCLTLRKIMVNNMTSPIPLAALSIASIFHFVICFCQTAYHKECRHVESTCETLSSIASDEIHRSWINNQKKEIKRREVIIHFLFKAKKQKRNRSSLTLTFLILTFF